MSTITSYRNMDPQILSARRLQGPTIKLPVKLEAQTLHHKNALNCLPDSKRDAVTSYNNDSDNARGYVRNTSVQTSQHAHDDPGERKTSVLKSVFSYRSLMVLLMHGSFVVTGIQRDCTSMAILCMFDEESSSLNSSASVNSSSVDYANEIKRNVPDWDSNMRGLVISAATFTSFLSPFVSHFLTRHFGGKRAMFLIMGTGCLLLFLSPIVARTDPYLMIALRSIIGISYGGNIPILAEFIGCWAPINEKLTMSAVIYTGFNTAGVLLFFLSGYVCTIPEDGGWPFIYYTNGLISLIWLVLWVLFSYQRPEEHPFISEKEKQYIIDNRPARREKSNDEDKIPYFTILKSAPVIAIIICASGHMWTLTLLMSFAPVYLNEAIHFSVQETGIIMSVVSGVRFLAAAFFTVLGNWLANRLTVTKSRKIVLSLGYGIGGASFCALAVVQYHNRFAVVGLMMLIFSLQMAGTGTVAVNPIDIAPRYASFISTAWFSVSAVLSITAPLLTTFLTSEGSLEGWRTLWYLSGTVFSTMVIVFVVFGDAKLQPWAQEPTNVTSSHSISITVDRDSNTNPETVFDSNDNNMWIHDYRNDNSNDSYDGGIDNPRFEMESYPGNTPNYKYGDSTTSRTSSQKILNVTSNGIRPYNHFDVPNTTRHQISNCSNFVLRTRL